MKQKLDHLTRQPVSVATQGELMKASQQETVGSLANEPHKPPATSHGARVAVEEMAPAAKGGKGKRAISDGSPKQKCKKMEKSGRNNPDSNGFIVIKRKKTAKATKFYGPTPLTTANKFGTLKVAGRSLFYSETLK